MKIRYMGHSSFEIETDKLKILTDPYYYAMSPGKTRRISPVKPEQIYDYILISHEHFDHCDTQLIDEIFSDKTKIITTAPASAKINHPCHTLKVGQEYKDAKITVQAKRAEHPQSEYPIALYFFTPEPLYFAGDTVPYVGMGDIDPPHVAFLPIGGKYTADIEGAAEIASLIRPDHVIPMHFNTWDEIAVADLNAFSLEIRARTMATDVHILKPGDLVEIAASAAFKDQEDSE